MLTKLKVERLKQDLTQMDLAIKAGVSISAVSHLERGKRLPAGKTLIRISKALNISPTYDLFKEYMEER